MRSWRPTTRRRPEQAHRGGQDAQLLLDQRLRQLRRDLRRSAPPRRDRRHELRDVGQQEHLGAGRRALLDRSRRPEPRHEDRPRERLRRRPERIRAAGLLRPHQLRLQGPLPDGGQRPLRRYLALRQGQPLGLFPLGVGGLAHLRGALLRPCQAAGGQPQAARLVRFAGQSERLVLLHLHASGVDQGLRQLQLRRRHGGQILVAGGSHRLRPDVGDRTAMGSGSRRGDAGQPPQS